MAQKSLDTQFNRDWEKAVAFASLHGIGAKDLAPIYQYDQSRVANGGYPMSMAERNRALLAAKNPNNVTPVPSDKPNPTSFLGNARNDLRSIFTGLAPNHLIPNVIHTAVDAVAHPQTWARPLEDVGQGVISGNLGEVKQGLDLAGNANSILNWLPGVYVLSELAHGGVDAVLAHPIVSLLDVAPFAPAGRLLDLAASKAGMASMAAKLGFSTPEALARASMPQMAASWVLARNIAKVGDDGTITPTIPGLGKLTKGTLLGPDGKPLTISGAFEFWGMRHSGMSKTVADTMAALFDMKSYGTEAHIYAIAPYAEAVKALQPEERAQLDELLSDTKLRRKGVTPGSVAKDHSIPENVRTAYSMAQDALALDESRAAVGQMVSIQGPRYLSKDAEGNDVMTRNTDWFGASGVHPAVVTAHTGFLHDLSDLMEVMRPLNENARRAAEMDTFVGPNILEPLHQANGEAYRTNLRDAEAPRLGEVHPDIAKEVAHATVSLERSKNLVFDPSDGIVAKAIDAASPFDSAGVPKRAINYAEVAELARLAKNDLQHTGHAQIDAGLHPNFGSVLSLVEQLRRWALARKAVEDRFTDEMLGSDYRRFGEGTKATELAVPKYRARPKLPKQFRGDLAKAYQDPKFRARLEAREAHMEQRSAVIKALARATGSYRTFEKAWWDQPADKWRSVMYDYMLERVLDVADKEDRIAAGSDRLRELGYADKQIDAYLSDERRLAAFIWQDSLNAMTDPHMPIIDDEEFDRVVYGAIDHVATLKEQGYDVAYMPVLRTSAAWEERPGLYGASVKPRIAELSSTKRRAMATIMPERYDVVAQVSASTKEAIERDLTIEFADSHIAPHALTKGEASNWAQMAYRDEFATLNPASANFQLLEAHKLEQMGLSYWNPNEKLGFTFPRWGNGGLYLPAGFAKALDQMLDGKRFRLDTVYDKGTRLFRFSILGLSPRYTAHIVFGGGFLLALRSDPRIVFKMGDAYRMVKEGRLPRPLRQSSTEVGIQELSPEPASLQVKALEAHGEAAGKQGAHMLMQEILGEQGILWSKASPVQWVRAAGELNYRFTNFVSSMYRAAAYLDHAGRAAKEEFTDPVSGVKMRVTPQRAKDEGIRHAQKVMGNLKAMTPLERTWFMRIMPFYGWTRHILDYVLTYPVDHPYRAQFLAVQAQLDSDSVAKAIDQRVLFMFFLGQPDAQGNVRGVDVRFMDPLRDVGNYATWGGWIAALNPALQAPIAMIDPNLIYGSTALYPQVTYDQFYGIETTTPQGNAALTGAEQFVSQLGALDAALNLSGQYRSLAQKNPNAFAKTIFQSLNIPFAQVQSINMKQLAVKGELARYRVASQAAKNAFSNPGMQGTGITDALAGYSSVPNPLNPDYEVTPAQLQELYNAAIAAYPGQNPLDVLIAPNTPAPSYTP